MKKERGQPISSGRARTRQTSRVMTVARIEPLWRRRVCGRAAMRALVKSLLPAPARRWARRAFGWRWLRGDYKHWAEARAASEGYDDGAVLARVLAATREVHAGRAGWERDGVTFSGEPEPTPLRKALERIAEGEGGRLDLIDFGGGLGTTWRQHRAWLATLTTVRWRVVEQPAWTEAGRRGFAGEGLEFYETLDEARADGTPAAILFSAVLPYVEMPRALLAEAVRRRMAHVIIDRTGFTSRGWDRLAVQHVPATIGAASYPCWLFDRESLLAPLTEDYVLVDEWALDELDGRHDFRGFYFQRRNAGPR